MVICLERSADLYMAQLIPLPLTVSCCSKIQIGFTFLVPAHPGSPGRRAVKWVCVCVYEPIDSAFRLIVRVVAGSMYWVGGNGGTGIAFSAHTWACAVNKPLLCTSPTLVGWSRV